MYCLPLLAVIVVFLVASEATRSIAKRKALSLPKRGESKSRSKLTNVVASGSAAKKSFLQTVLSKGTGVGVAKSLIQTKVGGIGLKFPLSGYFPAYDKHENWPKVGIMFGMYFPFHYRCTISCSVPTEAVLGTVLKNSSLNSNAASMKSRVGMSFIWKYNEKIGKKFSVGSWISVLPTNTMEENIRQYIRNMMAFILTLISLSIDHNITPSPLESISFLDSAQRSLPNADMSHQGVALASLVASGTAHESTTVRNRPGYKHWKVQLDSHRQAKIANKQRRKNAVGFNLGYYLQDHKGSLNCNICWDSPTLHPINALMDLIGSSK